MKIAVKILKWLGIIIVGSILIVILFFGITGIPKPRTITSENVPRLPLSYLKEAWDYFNKAGQNTSFVQWSPSGEYLYVNKLTGKIHNKLHTLNEPYGESTLIQGIPNSAFGVKMNPNPEKSYIIYALDEGGNEQGQLFKLDLSDQSTTMLSNGEDRYGSHIFDPFGRKLAYISNKRNKKDFDIYMMDPDMPKSEELLLEVEGTWFPASWSPGADKLLVVHYISVNENKLFILDIETKSLTPFDLDDKEAISYGGAVFGKDRNEVYYTSDYQSEFKRLRRRNLKTGRDSILSGTIDWDISNIERSKNGRYLGLTVNEGGVSSFLLYNLVEGSFEEIEGLSFGNVKSVGFHPSENLIGFNFSKASGWPIIYTYQIDSKKLTQWSKTNPEEDLFPETEIIQYLTFDYDSLKGKQREIAAFYYKPPKSATKPYPVLVNIHGGPESQSTLSRGSENEFFVRRGIALIEPNVRGSIGYGKTFSKLDNGKFRENAVKDIGALLDWIAQQPELDANRVVLSGGSYGGYMVLAAAVQYSDRLAGGVDVVGISNFVSFLENTKDYRRDMRREEYGDERKPEIRKFLEEISPRNHTDKIDIPLLIVQGKNDPRVPASESLKMVEEMQKAGKVVWYLEASNEGHGFRRPFNTMYYGMTKLKFLETYLLD